MKRLKIALFSISILLIPLMVSGGFVRALPCDDFDKTILGVPTWYKYLEGEVVAGKCKPVVNAAEDALPIGLAVLEAMMTLAGLVAVIMIFWGSFQYVLTQGEPDKAAGARKTAINAAVGLAIIIVATRVVSFIANTLTS